ncbi:MAG: C45 family autoproteolytic acyltransferase/hydrolase [Planctomycetota bacterium]
MSKVILPFIDCVGAPRELGRQYGEQAAEAIHRNAELAPATPEGYAVWAERCLRATLPELWEELCGIAEGSNCPLDRVLAMNHALPWHEDWEQGCTSIAIAGGPDGPLLGKNNDGEADGKRFVIRRSRPQDGLPVLQVTQTGRLSGLDAFNAAGLAVSHTSVGSRFAKRGPAIDIRLWMLQLLRHCRSTVDLLKALEKPPLPLTGKGYSIVAVDRAGSTVVIEAAVPVCCIRDHDSAFCYATNHFITDELAQADGRTSEQKRISTYRLGYLDWVAAKEPPGGLEGLQRILRSREPWAPCRHGGPHVSHTLWSMIAQPRDRRLLVSSGAPDEQAFQAYGFDGGREGG